MIPYVKLVRRGKKNSRVLLSSGETTLVMNSELRKEDLIGIDLAAGESKTGYLLPFHLLKLSKENLVSDKDGYDTYKCMNCGKEFKYGFNRPEKVFGNCPVTKEVFEDYKKERELIVFGCWTDPSSPSSCLKCGSVLVICPREGHPNSKFWGLKRNDGLELHVCPNGCQED